jgi:hypothetical protein
MFRYPTNTNLILAFQVVVMPVARRLTDWSQRVKSGASQRTNCLRRHIYQKTVPVGTEKKPPSAGAGEGM